MEMKEKNIFQSSTASKKFFLYKKRPENGEKRRKQIKENLKAKHMFIEGK